jgi:hypothetical protein
MFRITAGYVWGLIPMWKRGITEEGDSLSSIYTTVKQQHFTGV